MTLALPRSMLALTLGATAAWASLACVSSPPPSPSVAHISPRHAPLPPLDDAQIAELERDTTRAEIGGAQLAAASAHDPEVRVFARQVVDDDGALDVAERRVLARIQMTPRASDASRAMDYDERARLGALRPRFGADFDRAFVADTIEEDERALELIDVALLRAVKSHPLRQTLLDARPVVEMHLREARRLHDHLATAAP